MSKFCDQCGTQLNDDDAFCHNCGVACDISKRKTQTISDKANTVLSDLGVDNIIQGVSNYQKNQNIRREAIRSKNKSKHKKKLIGKYKTKTARSIVLCKWERCLIICF